MNNKICRIGLIGAGRIGRLHAEHIKNHLPQFHLIALADPHLDEQWARSVAVPYVSYNAEEVLCHPEVDAVLIASSSHLHLEHIKKASEAGKAIFCEKPIGLNEKKL